MDTGDYGPHDQKDDFVLIDVVTMSRSRLTTVRSTMPLPRTSHTPYPHLMDTVIL